MKKVDFPICEVSVPTVFENECEIVVRTRFNARSLAPRVRNGVARALRTGYVTTYSGQVAAWYRAVCKSVGAFPILITCTPNGKNAYQRGVFFAAATEDDRNILEAQERWTPFVLLANPNAKDNYRGMAVGHYKHRWPERGGFYTHNFCFDHLPPEIAFNDIKELFPSILEGIGRQEDAVTRWVAGGDFESAQIYTGERRITDVRATA